MAFGSVRASSYLGLLLAVLALLVHASNASQSYVPGYLKSGTLPRRLSTYDPSVHARRYRVGSGLGLGRRHSNDQKSQDILLLPTNVRPIHYNLTLEPSWANATTFDGRAIIDVDVKKETRLITLNSRDMTFLKVTLRYKDGEAWKSITDPKVIYNSTTEFMTLEFLSIIPSGSAVLDITYVGTLYSDDTLAGFYVSTYELPGNRTGKYVVTQFEAADARRAFPSWDEPAIKAPVTVTLVAFRDHVCLSNMDVVREETLPPSRPSDPERKAVTFRTTPPISTYLVAWAIGELAYYETDLFRIPIRVYVPPSQDARTTQFAAELAAVAMAQYEQELGVQFPLPKLDFLSVTDFGAGGMENWGLITMSSRMITVEKGVTRGIDIQRVAEVMVHELGHMWFGDLVGPEWWSQLWLNEGFAEFFSVYVQHKIFPEWHLDQEFVTSELGVGMTSDGLRSTHPIEVPVLSSRDAEYIFDDISYEKGASVLAMILSWLGHDAFFGGLRDYLRQQSFGSAVTEDLWAALSGPGGQNVTAKLDTWTKRGGFPILTVSENGCEVTLEQRRFLQTGDLDAESDETVWPVPLGLKTRRGVDRQTWLTERKATFNVSDEDFYIINANFSGIYRVQYPPERLKKLTRAASDGYLTVQELVGLAADVCIISSTATATSYPVTACMDFVSATTRGQNATNLVWEAVDDQLALVQAAWAGNAAVREALRGWKLRLIRPALERNGWKVAEDESVVGERLKVSLFLQAGLAGDDGVVATANDVFETLRSGNFEAYDEAMWEPALAIAVAHGDKSTLDATWRLVESPPPNYNDSPVWLRSFALPALLASPDAGLANATLSRLADLLPAATLSSRDILQIFTGATQSYGIAPAIFDWLRSDDGLNLLVSVGPGVAAAVLARTVGLLSTRPEVDAARQWLAGLVADGIVEEGALAELLAALETRVRWVEKDGQRLKEYLGVSSS